MQDGTAHLEGLSPERRLLFELLLKEKQQLEAQRQRIAPRAARAIAPLSFAQQRLWFLDQFEPNSAAYIMSTAVRLSGPLDTAALQASINAIVARHDVLRASIAAQEGLPVQTIAPVHDLPLTLIDLSGHTPAERDTATQQVIASESGQPFELSVGPLLRAALLRHSRDEHVLVLAIHHIASDAWSMGVFIEELVAGYRAHVAGQPLALAPLPIQYADFAAWQQEWMQGAALETQRAYWRQQLAGAPALLSLPTDRARPAVRSAQGALYPVHIPRGLTDALKALARQRQATLFTALLAAFTVLLARYSGQHDIIVGTPIAGRVTPETEPLIGLFANTLALRSDLSDDPDFLQVLDRAQRVTTAAYAHQDLPFDYVVRDIQAERPAGALPLVQVVFTLQNAPLPLHLIDTVALSFLEGQRTTAQFDLGLNLWESPDGLAGEVEYSTELFDQATIERMLAHLQVLIDAIVANPLRPISAIPLATAAERAALAAAQPQPVAAAQAAGIHQWFAQVAQRAGTAPALSAADRTWSYAELDGRANRIAHLLRELGVGPECCVGVCLERSGELVAALLGVLKAGGAYLPLDPTAPAERRAFMLRDAGCRVLLTEHAALGAWQPADLAVVYLDQTPGTAAEAPPERLCTDQIAYVIYTSGSTGQPKGVMVTHANVTRLLMAAQPWFGFGPTDVWTMFHAVSFDFSVWEIWAALLWGGRLVMVPHATSRAPQEFYALLARERVTVLNQTPSAFRQLMAVDEGPDAQALALRLVIFGGEMLRASDLTPWIARHGDQQPRLINMYGITETTVHVTGCPIGHALAEAAGSPIGAALPDLALYLLDSQLGPVPVGVPGEIYVAGAGLARGYLGRPDLTAERFVPNPFAASHSELWVCQHEAHEAHEGHEDQDSSPTQRPAALGNQSASQHHAPSSQASRLTPPASRLYHSGDMARRRADGQLEYLGRRDGQVKVRGYRIELGEIEATLDRHPAVRACAVIASGQDDGRQLVAYVVPAGEAPLEAADLRAFMQARLPDYMLPAAFVPLAELPLTANGKLDRRALPAPATSHVARAHTTVAPRTPVEAMIAEVWSSVLGLEQVGVYDNFFALGGHSLLATQVVARLRLQHEIELPLRSMFDQPTVAAQAEAVIQAELAAADAQVSGALWAALDGLSEEEIDAMLSNNEGQL